MNHVVRCTLGTLVLLFLYIPFFVSAEGASGQCDSAYNSCISQKKSGCEQQWQGCMSKCNVGGGAVGSCNKDPECQLHCTESATSQGGRISCCEGGPKHQNSCPNKVDGNCEPKKTEGGEGKMPELPKPPQGGGGEPQSPQDGCAQNGTSTAPFQNASSTTKQPCPQETSGLSNYFGSLFSSNTEPSDVVGSVQSTLSSAADKLSSFLFGAEPESDDAESANSTTPQDGNVVVPAGGTQLAPQVVQAQPISASNNSGGSPSAQVTGFGSQNTSASEQSGIMKAIGETLTGIGVTLKNLLSSFAL